MHKNTDKPNPHPSHPQCLQVDKIAHTLWQSARDVIGSRALYFFFFFVTVVPTRFVTRHSIAASRNRSAIVALETLQACRAIRVLVAVALASLTLVTRRASIYA